MEDNIIKKNQILKKMNKTKKELKKFYRRISDNLIQNTFEKLEKKIEILIGYIENSKLLSLTENQKIKYGFAVELEELNKMYMKNIEKLENRLYTKEIENYSKEKFDNLFLDNNFSIDINLNILLKGLLENEDELIYFKLPKLFNELEKLFDESITLFKVEIILSSIITEKQNTIIVGQNGVGKSELLKKLRETNLKNCFIIPANKYLYIDSENLNKYIDENEIENKIKNQKFKDLGCNLYSTDDGKSLFSYLVSFYVSNNCQKKADKNPPEISKLDKVKEIWKKIFPEIEIFTESGNRLLEFSKNRSKKYSLNQLSDGERSILFYLLIMVLIPEKSLIIIDEPETHLNIALCNKLWDYILEEKKENKFIFISHNKDFIKSRTDSDIIWCKNYDINNDKNNKFIKIEKNDILPRDLIVSLLGSKKEKILFCEGKDREGKAKEYDYAIYNLLYSDEYFVKPVEGHLSVIEYTKAYNELKEKLEMNSKEAYGIIDRDCLNNEEVQKLRSKNIIVLPANEIEMLMLHEKILEYYLQPHHENKEIKDKIEEFKEAFKNKLLERKDKVILNYVRSKCNKIFENRRIENFKTISELENSKNKIFNEIDLEKFQNELEIELEKIISEINYEEMLRVCSLKNEIIRTPKVGGIIDREYEEYPMKCLNVIKKNKELQNIIREYIGVPFDNNLNNN